VNSNFPNVQSSQKQTRSRRRLNAGFKRFARAPRNCARTARERRCSRYKHSRTERDAKRSGDCDRAEKPPRGEEEAEGKSRGSIRGSIRARPRSFFLARSGSAPTSRRERRAIDGGGELVVFDGAHAGWPLSRRNFGGTAEGTRKIHRSTMSRLELRLSASSSARRTLISRLFTPDAHVDNGSQGYPRARCTQIKRTARVSRSERDVDSLRHRERTFRGSMLHSRAGGPRSAEMQTRRDSPRHDKHKLRNIVEITRRLDQQENDRREDCLSR